MTDNNPTTTWRVHQIELGLDESEAALRSRAARRAGLEADALRGLRVVRKALDARRRGASRRLRFVYSVDLIVDRDLQSRAFEAAKKSGRVLLAAERGDLNVDAVHPSLAGVRAVVVGSGPAGMFAALGLAKNGVAVTLLERGPAIEDRGRPLVRFHRQRVLDPEANLLFGEGGAGTYSDGKIYTRVDDPLEIPLLDELVACGAPPEIVYDSLAHIGTDRLHRILPRLRARLRAQGVAFRFGVRFEGLVRDPRDASGVRAVQTSSGELPCDLLFLALGHSARDSWSVLREQGLALEPKPFQLGLRIEHPQELIDRARYGEDPRVRRRLGAASYNLVCRERDGLPSSYSFCMCPGGRIVAAINEPGLLCTNGMSNSTHSSGRATAAIVTTFGPEQFGHDAFDGIRFQRELEQRFFVAGGSDYTAPAQRADDFLADRSSATVGRSTWPFGTTPARLDRLLPQRARDAIRRALLRFERQIPGFAGPEGLFVGLESRSSGPLRATRDRESRRAHGFRNLFPVGEGSGHAGGIMSAALDGAGAALSCLRLGVS